LAVGEAGVVVAAKSAATGHVKFLVPVASGRQAQFEGDFRKKLAGYSVIFGKTRVWIGGYMFDSQFQQVFECFGIGKSVVPATVSFAPLGIEAVEGLFHLGHDAIRGHTGQVNRLGCCGRVDQPQYYPQHEYGHSSKSHETFHHPPPWLMPNQAISREERCRSSLGSLGSAMGQCPS
jgi:hypothetical protein